MYFSIAFVIVCLYAIAYVILRPNITERVHSEADDYEIIEVNQKTP